MKKIIKPLIVIVVICALVTGGLYGWYRYNNSKKIAKVVSLNNGYAMDGYWGDSIESYGQVTADKAQIFYLDKGTEIQSVNVAEGDHVEAGDVLMVVQRETQDIKGKELEVQKAQETLVAAQNRLERLKNTKPIPEYIAEADDTRTRVDEEGNEYEEVIGKFYYDAETGAIIGHESFTGGINYAPPTGYKPSELKTEIENQTKEVTRADLDFRIKAYQLDVMKNTNDNGEVIAKVSGTVSKVQSKDNYNATQPFLVVTATDEYYITGSIGEFYLDRVHIGDSVTIMSWDTGNSTEAIITSISDIPNTDNNNFYGGSGNTNSSNYEFTATFDKNSGIEIGNAVNISITPQTEEETGLYVQSEFIRKDTSGYYVMKMGNNNKLEKVYVKVGKSLWGYMLEVKSGVSMEDYLAFPYGNGAIEGISCEIVDSLDY